MRLKHLTITIFALLSIFALPWAADGKVQVKSQHSDPDAVEAVQAVYDTIFSLREFKADVNLVIQNEDFLKGFFTEEDGTSSVGIKGLLHYSNKSGCDLLLRRDATDYNSFKLGNTTSFTGIRKIKRKKGSDTLRIISTADATPTPTPTESPSASPEAEASPSPSPTPDFTIPDVVGKMGLDTYLHMLSPTRNSAPRDYPLSYVVPYELNSRVHGNVYTVVHQESFVFNTKCMEIQAYNPRSKFLTTLWIDTAHKRLVQVKRVAKDRNSQVKIIATYVGSFEPDKETGFSPYQRVEVTINGYPVFFAELTNPTINPGTVLFEEEKEEQGTATHRTRNNIIADTVVPFLSTNKLRLVIVLAIALAVFGWRYISFATSRQEFSDEIMVLDGPKGRFLEALTNLGYKVVPFSLEALSEERLILGKGATKDTTARPHAVIIAPTAFQEIRTHEFLVRAYVEEGGRVLVMRHPKQMDNLFPYKAEMIPIPNVGITVESDLNVLTSVSEEHIRRLVATYVTNEAYLKIDGHAFNKSLISLTNKLTSLKATTVGTVQHRKGEYMICQMQITAQSLQHDKHLQQLFNDIVRYLLGLEPLIYDNGNE